MALYCDFTGSYYDPAPWTHKLCYADVAVPEGCPIHFVTGAPIDPANIQAERIANGATTQAASSAAFIGSDDVTFSLMDTMSCDCHFENVPVSFEHVAVDVPSAVAGETVRLLGAAFEGAAYEVSITAPGPCPAPEWPTQYHAALACDICPVDPNTDSDGDGVPDDVDSDDDSGGCSAGGDPSVILAAFALATLARRRRAKIVSSE